MILSFEELRSMVTLHFPYPRTGPTLNVVSIFKCVFHESQIKPEDEYCVPCIEFSTLELFW